MHGCCTNTPIYRLIASLCILAYTNDSLARLDIFIFLCVWVEENKKSDLAARNWVHDQLY